MNGEAHSIRAQINALKARLLEVEGVPGDQDEETDLHTSAVCGHDEMIANLRRLSRVYGQDGRMAMASWEHVEGTERPWWYSCTMDTAALTYLLRNASIIQSFLAPIMTDNAMNVLWLLYEARRAGAASEQLPKEHREAVRALADHGYIESHESVGYSLTLAGWQTFCVLAQLCYVIHVKVDPQKSMKIAEAFHELYGVGWGEYLGIELDQVLENLRTGGWLHRLSVEGVSEDEIAVAVHEHNSPTLRSATGHEPRT